MIHKRYMVEIMTILFMEEIEPSLVKISSEILSSWDLVLQSLAETIKSMEVTML